MTLERRIHRARYDPRTFLTQPNRRAKKGQHGDRGKSTSGDACKDEAGAGGGRCECMCAAINQSLNQVWEVVVCDGVVRTME